MEHSSPRVALRPTTAQGRWLGVLLAVLISTGLAATGCGGEGSSPDAAPSASGTTGDGGSTNGDAEPTNACELMSEQEAEALAGNPLEPGNLMGVLCIWEPEDIEIDTNLQLSIGYVPAPPGADVDALCEAGLAGIPDSEPLSGTGLGNSAYWDFDDAVLGNAGSLHICFDGGFLDTAAIGLRPESELQEIAILIARTALDRL